nr:hypothetical protein [Bradyrhizobium icense]
MPDIDADRFLADLGDLRQIGSYKTGVHRPAFSPQDMQARHWLMDRMTEIGLEPSIDGIGNVYGRHLGPGPHLLIGSHIESQNHAGWLDGALGLVAASSKAATYVPASSPVSPRSGSIASPSPVSRTTPGAPPWPNAAAPVSPPCACWRLSTASFR